jgi:hypothetical protein
LAVSGCIIKDTRRIYNRKITKKSKNEKNLSTPLAMPGERRMVVLAR